jgi:hypothetical protein
MRAGLCSGDHVSVDGTPIESHASIKSLATKDGGAGGDANAFVSRNAGVGFRGQKRSSATHASRTDPEAQLYRKGDGQPRGCATPATRSPGTGTGW